MAEVTVQYMDTRTKSRSARGSLIFLVLSMIALSGCDSILSYRYGFSVEFPGPSDARTLNQPCTRSEVGAGTVSLDGRVLKCVSRSGNTRWVSVPERRDAKISVVLYGDSLGEEVSVLLPALLGPEYNVSFRVFGGTAPCDFVAGVRRDLRAWKPDVVVTSFIGNNYTPCTANADGAALGRRYDKALGQIASAAASNGATTIIVRPPAAAVDTYQARFDAVADSATKTGARLARAGLPVVVSDDGSVLNAPNLVSSERRGAHVLPCGPGEIGTTSCVNGVVVVRNPDGVHLCPSTEPRPGPGLCVTRSPGAERYTAAIAETIKAVVSKQPIPRPSVVSSS